MTYEFINMTSMSYMYMISFVVEWIDVLSFSPCVFLSFSLSFTFSLFLSFFAILCQKLNSAFSNIRSLLESKGNNKFSCLGSDTSHGNFGEKSQVFSAIFHSGSQWWDAGKTHLGLNRMFRVLERLFTSTVTLPVQRWTAGGGRREGISVSIFCSGSQGVSSSVTWSAHSRWPEVGQGWKLDPSHPGQVSVLPVWPVLGIAAAILQRDYKNQESHNRIPQTFCNFLTCMNVLTCMHTMLGWLTSFII